MLKIKKKGAYAFHSLPVPLLFYKGSTFKVLGFSFKLKIKNKENIETSWLINNKDPDSNFELAIDNRGENPDNPVRFSLLQDGKIIAENEDVECGSILIESLNNNQKETFVVAYNFSTENNVPLSSYIVSSDENLKFYLNLGEKMKFLGGLQ